MDGQTVLADTTDYAASAVATGINKEMIYICGLFEAKFMENWEETVNKL